MSQANIALAALLFLSSPALAGADAGHAPDEPPPAEAAEDPDWSEADAMRLANLREDIRARLTLQRVLLWYSKTRGEESITSETYRGHEALFSTDTLKFLDRALARRTLDADEARALRYLKSYVALEYINLRTSPFDDRIAKATATARARLSWRSEPVPYRGLEALAAAEKDPARRREIEAASERIWAEVLNPLMAEKEALVRTLAVEAGYASYIDLAERYRQVDLKALIGEAAAFLHETDALYHQLLEQQAREVLGKPADQVTRADLRFLSQPPRLTKFFPKEMLLESFDQLLEGLGLSLETAAGTKIRIDDAPAPEKSLEPVCVPVRVPRDVRLSLSPADGPGAFGAAFHEAGHALHYANTMTPVLEFQSMGSAAAVEGYAEFFHYMWDDPAWLRRYRKQVEAHNLRSPKHRLSVLTDRDIARVVRHRVFWDLYYLRRVAFAKIAYETLVHGGAPELTRGVIQDPDGDVQEVYRQLFSEAYGIPLTAEEALRFRNDVDPFLFSADHARAFLLAHQLHEALRAKLGPDWYGEPRAGEVLRGLWADGTKWTADEVARQLGASGLSFAAVKTRIDRLIAEAAALEADRR
jgi:hypothetical protein